FHGRIACEARLAELHRGDEVSVLTELRLLQRASSGADRQAAVPPPTDGRQSELRCLVAGPGGEITGSALGENTKSKRGRREAVENREQRAIRGFSCIARTKRLPKTLPAISFAQYKKNHEWHADRKSTRLNSSHQIISDAV